MKPLQALETITALNKPVDESIYNEAINVLRQSLTHPTADEVCMEMEEYFYRCVGKANPYIKYIQEEKKFIYITEEKNYDVIALDRHGYIAFQTTFPHYLVALIARFYGGLE